MSRRQSSRKKTSRTTAGRIAEAGQVAKASQQTLQSYSVGALPILNRLLERMDLENIFRDFLRAEGPRTKVPTAKGLLVLLRNLLISRQAIYGLGEWAAAFAPDLLNLTDEQLTHFNDDRVGRCLDRLFESDQSALTMAVVRRVMDEFQLSLDELHNDSTSVSFFGAYDDAAEESRQRGRSTVAVTYGHSKDHRPDLKQILYTLTVSDDGGVPVYFTTHSGNTVDDQTHCQTWDVLRDLVGRADFLYVADCKLASTDNMKYIARQGGRFVTVLPATRKENQQFRRRLESETKDILWDPLYQVRDDREQVVDRLSVCPQEMLTKEKYRLWWFHSTRKASLDHTARMNRIQRAIVGLGNLRGRLLGPRPRLREAEQVQPLVTRLLEELQVSDVLRVEIRSRTKEQRKQTTPGRPGKNTRYKVLTTSYCDLAWEIDTAALTACQQTDRAFPLITNARELSAEEVLRAYKRQPIIEKRFSQLKTDFEVAPMYLKNVSRIQALLCLYFFALVVQTLLERELRQAMQRSKLESLPLYPEGRACKAPTARRLLDIFAPLQRHTLHHGEHSETITTELTQLQRNIPQLLKIPPQGYGL